MTENGMSIADYLAISKDGGTFGGNGGFLWVILIFLFFLAFGGGFGNGFFGNGVEAATNFNLSQVERDVLETSASTQREILDSRYTTQIGFQGLSAQMAQCCCDLKTEIISQNQITRDLIQANYINGLQTALSDAKSEISNHNQNEFILNTIGQWRAYPSVNPYTCYNSSCGCNSNNLI